MELPQSLETVHFSLMAKRFSYYYTNLQASNLNAAPDELNFPHRIHKRCIVTPYSCVFVS